MHFVGYGPSASTIGASRAARRAAMEIVRQVAESAQPERAG
ncbi:hypothetical protein N803_14235 [Knoellia subterranea KCTC 19937]|uniref:Uncharacterized protein n=1 Tax=Knoellia subterranea KCTC 19937 TaxID=1385521 RepID=A0A0A0JKJ1_9MICO|nr:hypothetical protein N803_14235 [Knoellia subterranea KCTC 19937]